MNGPCVSHFYGLTTGITQALSNTVSPHIFYTSLLLCCSLPSLGKSKKKIKQTSVLYTCNLYNIVHQLYFNFLKINKNKSQEKKETRAPHKVLISLSGAGRTIT